MTERIIIIGAGHMGAAIVIGLLSGGHTMVHVVDPDENRLVDLRERNIPCTLSLPIMEATDAVVLAMPPQAFQSFAMGAERLHGHQGPIISVMAGVHVATITKLLNAPQVIRAIPNTPSEVGKGMTVFFAAEDIFPGAVERAIKIFDAFGKSVRVSDESLIDPSAAYCGGGPAFVAFFADALQRFAAHSGLNEADSTKVALQVLRGTADLMEATGKPAMQICKEVMTPNGTTEQGIRYLEACGMREIICAALEKASARSQELGLSLKAD